MQDLFEEIIDYLKGIWLKRRYIIIATWLICPLGWYAVSAMPDVYESEARVYVDTQSLLRPLLKGLTVETNPNTQIRLMIKTLLSRPNLERIARMTDLDVQANNNEEHEEILKDLKKNIKISGGGRENIYTLSIEDKDPEMARNIVRSALTVFIENTLGETRSDSDSAQKFLNTQIKDYENRLSNSEARLTSFKQKYSGILPEQSGGYYTRLNNDRDNLKAIELDILENKTRLESAKKQLSQSIVADAKGDNKIKSDSSIQTTYDDRITELEVQLDTLKLRYTDRHPDVIEVSRNLAHLNKLRSSEIEKYLAQNSDSSGSLKRLSANPVIQEVQIEVNQLENLIASLNVRADNYRQRIIELENRVHTLPEIEAQLVALNRGYDITKEKYLELLGRKETAQLAQQADETTDKIQFRTIDPPLVATKPSGPKRFILFAVITILGFGVGIGLSLLMSLLNPVATSTVQLSKATGVPIFGVVSANENLGLQKWHKKKTFIFVGSNFLLLCLLVLFISYFIFPNIIQAPLKRIF
ncbi:XrtA system polysaccharide chain length determinant [Colwellia psychrerythraea]|uniref:Polysaccharide chain length determinant protein, PEP-CTERM locus subfamily n=1 Tax=Colwellia psychrerythraea TaxID=28229 RepID=A0A099L3P3_COLPS|nr:XrtA system polysaccharide chain length determinant [Colwellia psychrerythraea]KGJ96767.1 polysaccharide chain length determinant protein, PEP-CTERM locus subfamily [Colwellia psychrerythraea]